MEECWGTRRNHDRDLQWWICLSRACTESSGKGGKVTTLHDCPYIHTLCLRLASSAYTDQSEGMTLLNFKVIGDICAVLQGRTYMYVPVVSGCPSMVTLFSSCSSIGTGIQYMYCVNTDWTLGVNWCFCRSFLVISIESNQHLTNIKIPVYSL